MMQPIAQYISGDDTAGEKICKEFEPHVRAAVHSFLGRDDADCDDVVQDTFVALLGYLRKAGIAPENPIAFTVTIARNRCRNLMLWRRRRHARDVAEMADKLPQIAASPLDLVDLEQRRALLRDAVDALEQACRSLLRAIYRQERSIESLRVELGLGTVQAVYHRRNICLKKAQSFLNQRLFDCRSIGNGKPRASKPGSAGEGV